MIETRKVTPDEARQAYETIAPRIHKLDVRRNYSEILALETIHLALNSYESHLALIREMAEALQDAITNAALVDSRRSPSTTKCIAVLAKAQEVLS